LEEKERAREAGMEEEDPKKLDEVGHPAIWAGGPRKRCGMIILSQRDADVKSKKSTRSWWILIPGGRYCFSGNVLGRKEGTSKGVKNAPEKMVRKRETTGQ